MFCLLKENNAHQLHHITISSATFDLLIDSGSTIRGYLHVKFHPGIKSSLSIVKYFLLFSCFCRDEISSWKEHNPVKKTGMRFHPGMKKRKKDV